MTISKLNLIKISKKRYIISIMNIVEGIVLGLIQGVTEFLPISSSGHLLLIPKIFNFSDPGLAVDAVLHISTAIAILLFFWKDWWLMLKSWKKSEFSSFKETLSINGGNTFLCSGAWKRFIKGNQNVGGNC